MDLATSVFLTANERDRFQLFTVIKDHLERVHIFKNQDQPLRDDFERDYSAVNLREIAKFSDRTYGSLYNSYLQIVDDFKIILGKDNPSERDIFNYKTDLYRFYLMTNSYSYKFIKISLRNEGISFMEFLAQNKIAKSTALRHLKPLRLHLKKYGIRMVYDEIGFAGDETIIRLALTNLLWAGTNGITWPFIMIDRATIDTLYQQLLQDFGFVEINQATSELVRYGLAVTLERIIGGHKVKENPTQQLLLFPFPQTIQNFLLQTNNDTLRTHRSIVDRYETSSLYLQLNILPFRYEAMQPIDFLLKSIKVYNQDIIDIVDDFMFMLPEKFMEQYSVSILEKRNFKLNLVQVVIGVLTMKEHYKVILNDFLGNVSFFGIDKPTDLEEVIDEAFVQLEFEPLVQRYLNYLPMIKYGFFQLFRRLGSSNRIGTKVKIAINVPVNSSAYTDIYNFLRDNRLVELQKYTDIDRTTDIIATTISKKEDFQPLAPNAVITHVDDPLTDTVLGLFTILILRSWRYKVNTNQKLKRL